MGIGDIFKIKQFKTEIEQLKTENQNLLNDNQNMHQQLQELGAFDYYKILDMTEQLKKEYEAKKLTAQEDFQKHLDSIDKSIAEKNSECQNILNQLEELRSQEVKLNKNVKTQTNKLNKSKELVKAINYTFDKYLNYEPSQSTLRFPENQLSELEEISPSVILKLHCMDIKDLRKALEAERKKVEKEESKYNTEIEKLQNQLQSASSSELEQLNARILQLQAQLSEVVLKKEEISNLANGKAGNVYVISNLGSFGENVFKIGMTRRLNPQDRVDELGNASVPFKFDVHSFIFSDDAVGLESKLHEMLNQKRVNKVNMRKEFFNVTIDELEELVTEIEPTAEFNRTMAAEEYRQSLSTTENYSKNYVDTDEDDEELE